MSGLSFQRVSFKYPTSGWVLRELALTVSPGQVTWLFGPLGAGASTLLLVAAGLAPSLTGGTLEGKLMVLGQDISTREGRRVVAGKIGYVTAMPYLQLSAMAETVYDEVAFAPANLGWPRERIEPAVERALARLGIGHLRDREPEVLSGGELQRVVIAAMAVLEPELWLLDEPTSALDQAGRAQVRALMREEAARGAAVLLASEDAELGLAVADEAALLDEGSCVARDVPRTLLGTELMWELGGGSTNVAELARAARLLAGGGKAKLAPPYPLTVEAAVEAWR